MTSVLAMEDVTRDYGKGAATVHALAGISLSVEVGELVAVMGPSGSGKSTLLSIAGGLEKATSGRVLLAGEDLATKTRDELAELRRTTLGYVFQDFNLVPALTALENVMLPLELDDLPESGSRALALEAMERVGIAELQGRFVDQMSGGQRQRAAIARAIVGGRQLVLADEPTGALDTSTGDEIMALLRDLVDEGVAVITVTHEARHAGWADRVLFVRDGLLVDQSVVDNDLGALLTGTRRGQV